MEHLVLGYNRALAVDGVLLPGVATALKALAMTTRIHAVTANTFGPAAERFSGLPVDLIIVPKVAQADRKL